MTTWLSTRGLKLILGAFVVAYALNSLAATTADPDLWGFLAFGRLFWNSPSFPYEDVFSFTPTLKPWVYHEWLSGVIFYPIYQAFGAAGLQVLKYGVGLTTIWFLYRTAVFRGAHPLAVGFILALVLPGFKGYYLPLRPQVFTFLFFAIFLYILESTRLKQNYLYLLWVPLLMLPWANLHGGFAAGLGLILLYGAGELLSRRLWLPYLMAFVGGFLVTAINPYGIIYWRYMYEALTMPRPMIIEWIPLWEYFYHIAKGFPIYICLLAITMLVLGLLSRWHEVTPMLVLLTTLVLGVRHIRHLMFFFMTVICYIPVCLRRYEEDLKERLGKLPEAWRDGFLGAGAGLALGLAVALGITFLVRGPFALYLPGPVPKGEQPLMYYPLGAAAYLELNGLRGRLAVDFGWGEYILWRFYPHLKVSMDGRFETVYPQEVVEDHLKFRSGQPGWRDFLTKYEPDLILIKSRGPLADLLRQEPHWQIIYEDAGSVLWHRTQEKTEKSIR